MGMTDTLKDRIKLARKEAKLTQDEVARAIQITQPTYSELETGKSLGSKHLAEIAHLFGVNALWLASGKGQKHAHDAAPGTSNIHQISEGKQGYDSNTLPAPSFAGRLPLISWVQAGNWAESPDIYAPGDAEEWLLQAVPNAPNCFALRVSGPSMDDGTASGYRDGDIIHVNPDAEWKHNDDVIVKNGGDEVTFKRLVCQGDKCHLVPLNPSWPDKIIPLDAHCTIIGVVVFSGRYR
jgi:SOS-response transcriptional repressor LexA